MVNVPKEFSLSDTHTHTFFLDFIIDVVDVDCVVWSDIHVDL